MIYSELPIYMKIPVYKGSLYCRTVNNPNANIIAPNIPPNLTNIAPPSPIQTPDKTLLLKYVNIFIINLQGNPLIFNWWEELQQAFCLVKHYS